LDIGNDLGGSVRQPAHFCGIYALKPTDRRISTLGMIPETPGMPYCLRQMITVGCFGRSIADLQLSFEIIAGADLDRPDVPPVPLDRPSSKAITDLKLAWIDEWDEVPVDLEIKAAIQKAVGELDRAGANVERWLPSEFDLGNIFQIYERMAAYVNNYTQPRDRYIVGRSVTLLWRSATQGDADLRRLSNFSRALPEMLNPTTKGYFETLTERDRLPIGMQIVGKRWQEMELLAIAQEIDRVFGKFQQRPF
jgi:amidase